MSKTDRSSRTFRQNSRTADQTFFAAVFSYMYKYGSISVHFTPARTALLKYSLNLKFYVTNYNQSKPACTLIL